MATETQSGSRLENLAVKYGRKAVVNFSSTSPRTDAYSALDSATYRKDKAVLRRMSSTPLTERTSGLTTIQTDLAAIQLDLTELAETYGKLNVSLKNTIGRDKLYSFGDAFKIGMYSMVGKKKAVREIRLDAVNRKGNAVEYLVNRMSEVLGEQYQKALDGKSRAEQLQSQNIAHMKTLDKKLIDSLKSGRYTFADQTEAEKEVSKLESELKDIDDTLLAYERDVNSAKAAGEVDKVRKLTDEMSQVLDMKHDILDGRLSADGVVSNIRRDILDHAEGVQSAKGATAASKVNYQAISALTDSMNELSIKYKHALEDMIPVFRIQGATATIGAQALQLKQALLDVANVSNRLMEANSRLVTHLAAETFDLLRTPIYDQERARQVEQEIRDYMTGLNKVKMEWAENQQSMENIAESARNVVHK